jgi:hypothetical protein
MLYGDRQDMRSIYFEAWRKHKENEPLTAVEQDIVALLHEHPEYHALMDQPTRNLEKDFHPEWGDSNPFAHLAVHLIILEQLRLDRPEGFREVYQQLLRTFHDEHETQHQILEVFSPLLWNMLQQGTGFNDELYLERLRKLLLK